MDVEITARAAMNKGESVKTYQRASTNLQDDNPPNGQRMCVAAEMGQAIHLSSFIQFYAISSKLLNARRREPGAETFG